MAKFPWKMVTIDIDGTLTLEHGWRPIAAARGRMREYEHSRRALLAKREDEDTHLTRLFELAEGLDRAALDALFEGTRRVRWIPETVERLHALGARVPLLTHNPGFVIQWYSRKFGFDGGSGGWGLSMRHGIVQRPWKVRADKVRGLRAIRRRFPVPPGAICHIGDAWPDARLAPLIGGFIAFNPKSAATARAADATLSSGDLREVLPILGRLRPRRPVNDAHPLDEPSNSRAAGTA